MLTFDTLSYDSLLASRSLDSEIWLADHLGGFSKDFRNPLLDHLENIFFSHKVWICFKIDEAIKKNYPGLDLKWITPPNFRNNVFMEYRVHPELTFEKFICTFNGTAHVSRQLLTAALQKFGWFDTQTCSKNHVTDSDAIDGHVKDFVDNHRFYRKFFISDQSADLARTINSFGFDRFNHSRNIYNLESKLTSSFLHVVSETMATSYYPFVTEKFLYSVVTRGLFVAYAPPNWHQHVEKIYGFKLYKKLFDYSFDSIQNPIHRLVALMSMISKFSVLSQDDWRDLYEMETDTIEYNYEHYFSKNYIKHLEQLS